MMPPVKIASFRNKPIGAGLRQPGNRKHFFRRQPDAVRHDRAAVFIIAAAAGLAIKQTAANAGPVNIAGVIILQLGQATFAATVTQGFPFLRRHFFQCLGRPERLSHGLGLGICRDRVKARGAAILFWSLCRRHLIKIATSREQIVPLIIVRRRWDDRTGE